MCTVSMAKYSKIGTAQSTSVDETRVTQSIRQNQASLSDEVWNNADIGKITSPEQQRGFCPLKRREGGFEMRMGRKGSTDQARSSGSRSILFSCMDSGTDDFRMGCQSQVIVGGQQDDLAPCMLDCRPCA